MTSAPSGAGDGAYAAPSARIEDLGGSRQTHLGTASFVIAVLAGIAQAAVVVAMVVAVARHQEFRVFIASPQAALLIAAFYGGIAAQVIGVLFGIAGMFGRRYLHSLACMGLACNLLPLLVISSLSVLGPYFK
jgi:hypothetical protein